MPSPSATPTPVTPPRVPLIDPRTGLIDRAWYMFFVSLVNAAELVYEGDIGPNPESLIASYDAALQALAQNVETQPLPVDLSAELIKQIEAAGLADYATGLLSQIAEMQKQLEALNLLPPPSQGTVVAVTGTAPVVSSGGIAPNISMAAANTSTDGYLTSTDWNTFNNKAPATSGTSILYGNGSGGFNNVTTGSGVSFVAGVLSATGSGGTITSVTATAPIASSGGFTPNISIDAAYGDTVNPYAAKTANFVLAGPTAGAAAVPAFRALVAADIPVLSYVTSVSGTTGRITSTGGTTPVIDLASGVATPGTTGSSTLVPVITIDTYGRVTSITTAANPQGTVTSVTGTSPVVSSGGATPAISMPAATTSVNGYLTSTDWNTFNNKGSGSVTSVAASVPSFLSIAGSPITTSGTLAISLSGTALPTTSGGTGLTSFTANGVVYASSTSALATSSAFVFNGTGVGMGTSSPVYQVQIYGSGQQTAALTDAGNKGASLLLNTPTVAAGDGGALLIGAGGSGAKPFAAIKGLLTDGGSNTTGDLAFSTRNSTTDTALTERLRLLANGNFGIGTSSAGYKLTVAGTGGAATINLLETGVRSWAIRAGGAATNVFDIADFTAGASRLSISSAGIVTMSAYGAGAATFSAAGVISSVSDETWKTKDGVPVNPDAMIKKLQPGYWYYNEEKSKTFGKDRQLGFYAQNVNAAIGPEAAPEPEEGKPWGYYDRSVLAVVVMSLQNALDTIDSLTARVAALEQK